MLNRPAIQNLIDGLRRMLPWEDAIALAIEERTGKESEEEATYTVGDAQRANEIMRQCWRTSEAETK